MTQSVNINHVCKRKARAEKKVRAAQANARHGQSKGACNIEKSEREKAVKKLDAHRRES